MEDYIQGIVCGYLTVQNGTRDDAKRRRLFVVLSDARMDYYAADPRPEFVEAIAESYVFVEKKTQAHHYAEMNARAPLHSFCLTTDKMTDVYIAESAAEAELWIVHLRERLEALHQMVVGALMMRKEIAVTQQVQRKLLQTKYMWRAKHVELGRSTLQFCSPAPQRRQQRAMNQFTLTAESYASEEPVEVLKSVAFAGFAVSSGALSASELKKLQKDPKLQAQLAKRSGGGAVLGNGIVYPFVVCTGPAHLHLAAASEKEREEWIVAIKLRIVALKYRHNGRNRDASLGDVANDATRVRMHDFMEVQTTPGGPWERRYVELENEMLKVKLSDRTLGSKFETRLLPSCALAPSLLKANAFVVQNRSQEIALAPGRLQDAQRWQRAILGVAQRVTLARCRAVFHDELAALLAHSVVYTVPVAGAASAGLVVEKHKKRVVVLSHAPPTAAESETKAKAKGKQPSVVVPEGSVLLGIAQDGMVHDSFETIWHRLRQKKGYHSAAMRLTFRAPMHKAGLLEVKHKPKARWALRRCALRNGKLRVETALPSDNATVPSSAEPTEGEDGVVLLEELALRHCRVELLPSETLGVRNTLKITVSPGGAHLPQHHGHHHHHTHRTLYLRVHHDGDLFVWFALLTLECAVAQDDPALPLALHTLQKRQLKASQGYAEDQRRQTSACRVAGQLLADVELAAAALEAKLLQRARAEHQQQQRDDQLLLLAPESPVALGPVDVAAALHCGTARAALSDDDARQLFQHLDAIGCGKISSSAVAATLEALTRQLEPRDRDAALAGARSALAKLVPASRQFASITLEQTVGVLRNVSDPRVTELVRKFARHEIQCM